LIDDFEGGLRPNWEARPFKGETRYDVVSDDGGHVLRARSDAAASGLVYPIRYVLRQYPVLAWRWKVENVIAKGDETRRSGDDYAGRVYVVFPHWFFPKTRSINYIWANRLPKGRRVRSPFTANAVMIAAESGPEHVGRWVSERRDVLADYRQAFGEEPPEVGAIAVMTDTDNTGESATAYYDDIRVEAK
jgi:hypothetical protein